MKRNRYRKESAGEPVVLPGTTYRPIAGYSATSYGFTGVGLFKASGRPLRIEIEGSDGAMTLVPIRDMQSMVMGALLILTVASWVIALMGRRGS
ncbi:MAG: hypothetical protein OEM22_02905 [Acidimicrobiia bacterium]|nr:hypothetical protein [Acidimicrobiia bacterium]MDH3471355.1 hypothetical protein [Acidimicrobiia bacterium]